MSMMDMAEQGRVLCEAARVLRPGGFLQFSILHPCFVPPDRRVLREPDRTTRAIEIAGYFDATDGRIDTFWLDNVPQEERDKTEPFRVPRFHRTARGSPKRSMTSPASTMRSTHPLSAGGRRIVATQ
jgi:SAM-dependent methyltransferase